MKQKIMWAFIAVFGSICLAVLALHRGETISALWLVCASISVYLIAYRFYSRFIANRVLLVDPARPTPAHTMSDGLDYVPTHKWVLFGHHFAAIAGAGPLVGPVLAAQMGYLPGTLWILAGVVLAGAVQDMIILFLSTRRNGASLGEMIRREMGSVAGIIALVGIMAILIILLAVLGMVVVKALIGSPWGVFTLAATIPIALFMGVYLRYIRPGKVGEISVIGFAMLMFALLYGQTVAAHPYWGQVFNLDGKTLTLWLMGYGFIASVLPVWLLLAPRDYLSTFLKIGTIIGLAIGILVVNPPLLMPAATPFIDGTGPVFSGSLFPFLFITIACGAVSGFHALVSSGTTPKMIDNEGHVRPIGYGAMLVESFVAIMALIAACVLDPGVYFALNSGPAVIGTTVESAAAAISSWGFVVTPEALSQLANDMGEGSILSRTGGAPTFAVGMAHILSQAMGGGAMMAFWYHFAILFEALFILTTLDAGTRVCRFLMQDLLGTAVPAMKDTNNLFANLIATSLVVSGWGYFLYQGVSDPFGGINTLWALFGISNQMLAGIALILATVALVRMGRGRLALVPAVPAAWVLLITLIAGWQKLFSEIPAIGFLSHADVFSAAIARGEILAPATTMVQMQSVLFNDRINAFMTAFFMVIVVAMVFFAIKTIRQSLNNPDAAKLVPAQEYA
ncbi:MAG: carbon starvation CstA family protein [Pseudomonadota bacterium]|nr:carbon starvation protein A [Gammaproteobacteria bacterium]MBJ55753.1 carbon starvation protein A [Gammaproteobacteria bacterium]MEC8860771.1 carbon starvation CstA family protein [Pseudomonadota bacterium]|tara:strand:- start:1626 stop:3665 length:2040 start_codon:yes stop_codon:yes gene_type:complete